MLESKRRGRVRQKPSQTGQGTAPGSRTGATRAPRIRTHLQIPNDMDIDNPMTPKRGTNNGTKSPAKKVRKTDSNTDKSLGKGQEEAEITDPPELECNSTVVISPGGSGEELLSSDTEDEEETPAEETEAAEIYVRYVPFDPSPFSQAEIMPAAEESLWKKRGYKIGQMGKKFYRMIPGVNMDTGEKDFDIEAIKSVVTEVVGNNNLSDLHSFVYHCQNTDIEKLELLNINSHKLLQACVEVKHLALVLKGDPSKSKLWMKEEFVKHRNTLNKRRTVMEKANAKIKEVKAKDTEVIYSFLDMKDEDGKFGGNHSASKSVANQSRKESWQYDGFRTYASEKGKGGAKHYSLGTAFKKTIEPVWKLEKIAGGKNYDDVDVEQKTWKIFLYRIFTLSDNGERNVSRQEAQLVVLRLAKTSPEIFPSFDIHSGILRFCKFGYAWKISNEMMGSRWGWNQGQSLPERPPKPTVTNPPKTASKSPKKDKGKPKVQIQISDEAQVMEFDKNQVPETINAGFGTYLTSTTKRDVRKENQFTVCEREPRNFKTYIMIGSPHIMDKKDWSAILEGCTDVMKTLTDVDTRLVVYPYPKEFQTPKDIFKPMTKDNFNGSNGKKSWKDKEDLVHYVATLWNPQVGKKYFMRFLIGHNCPIDTLTSSPAVASLQTIHWSLIVPHIQAAAEIPAVWLVGPYVQTFDCEAFTRAMKNDKRFSRFEIAVKKGILKCTPDEKTPDWNSKKCCRTILIHTSKEGGMRNELVKQCISVFNKKVHASKRIQGYSFTALQWHGTKGIRPIPYNKLRIQKKGKRHQINVQQSSVKIPIHGIIDLDFPIYYNGMPVTPRGAIITMRTSTHWATPIFTQIDETRDGIVAICHKSEAKEAQRLIANLYTLMKAKFGGQVSEWFDDESRELSEGQEWNSRLRKIIPTDTKIDDELLRDLTSFKESSAEIARILEEGGTEEDLHPITKVANSDGEDDDDTSLSSKEEDVDRHRYEIDQIFSLVIPPKAGPQHDDASFGTNATGGITEISKNSNKSAGSQSTTSTTNTASKALSNLSFANNMGDDDSIQEISNNKQVNTQVNLDETSTSNENNNSMDEDQDSSTVQRPVLNLTNE